MKNLIYLFAIALLYSCATPTGTVDGISYENGKAIVTGTLKITTPTQAQADSTVNSLTKGVFVIENTRDSANVHFYDWKFTSPSLR